MSQYTFTFKKDNIFVEFTTTDKEIVEKQFQIWVADADAYAKNKSGKTLKTVAKTIQSEEKKIIEPKIVEPIITGQVAEPKIEEKITELPQEVLTEAQPQPEIIDKASTLLKTINTIQNEQETGSKEEETKAVSHSETEAIPPENFEKVLEQSIENPTFEPTKTQDKIFLNLVNSKNTTDKFHYLIITAYYLSEFEKQERFSLKQINSKLMQNLSEVIDHVTLQDAINQNFIELVPDLTGISDVAEYKLTRAGEEFFASKI